MMLFFGQAIAWSPHHHGLLASGGGTADRCIRFWNTLTGQPMQSIDTGSQVIIYYYYTYDYDIHYTGPFY
jgi:WD40 repeat protein